MKAIRCKAGPGRLHRCLARLAALALAPLLVCSPVALAQSGGSAATTTAAPGDSGTDPVSLQAIQEGVRTFKQRREVASGAGQAGGSVRSERHVTGRAEPKSQVHKPPGASAHQGREAKAVTATQAQRLPLTAEKQRPRTPRASSSRGMRDTHAVAASAGQIGFAGSATTPPAGIDPRIRGNLAAAGENRVTYAFLLMKEMPGLETEQALRQLGVTPLGLHGSALKVRVPLQPKVLDGIADLPGLQSLAYPLPEQKISPDLKAAAGRFGPDVDQFPVIVNLFEADAKGALAERLRATKAELGRYDASLHSYEMLASPEQIEALSNLDFVLFIEIERRGRAGHDQSMATNGVDYIRGSGFLGSGVVLGLLDTGAMLGADAAVMHEDLNKFGCGRNFTTDAAGVWNDQNGHGSHVLGTISGTGTAQERFRGVAPALGDAERVRVGKIWNSLGEGMNAWLRDGIDFMAVATECDAARPQVINISGGASGIGQTGTDEESRKLDAQVWATRQAYIVCSGNSGPDAQTIWSPGVAKNALTVGSVLDAGDLTVGELDSAANGSSRGPTGDGRMKPDIVSTGNFITSVRAGTTNAYIGMRGCSMATPHVSGIAASLLEHFPDFRDNPHLLRAHLMASSILHSDQTTRSDNFSGGRNDYGLGRVADYQAHWARADANGWSSNWAAMTETDKVWNYFDIDVPEGAQRLVVVLTWDEPAASAGAARAVTYDIDLWADYGASCTPDAIGQCGQWASQSDVDNVEYLIINAPAPGTYRLKAVNWRVPESGLPVAIAATIIRGDPTPPMTLAAAPSSTTPPVGSTFTVTTSVTDPAWAAYGVQVSVPTVPAGLTLLGVSTTREDGVAMDFPNATALTLGTVTAADTREAVWRFRADTSGSKTVRFRAWSNNGGTVFQDVTVTP
jgi:serine protease AprX